ncbi:MAG: hypothetical protein CMO80_24530 [Verrucomicrobiales bacterium]|nr:hypothetical protein [Verrucomicrobiales bacterium]
MGKPLKLLVVSDIHYAGPGERERSGYEARSATNVFQRELLRLYRGQIWLEDPLVHNHFLDWFMERAGEPDIVVANGDFSCDSAFTGHADDASFESAQICLNRLRERFGKSLHTTIGDHELGKKSLVGGLGGLRLKSFEITRDELGVQPFWQFTRGNYVFMGVTSSLLALPVLLAEGLEEEFDAWRELRDQHVAQIDAAFRDLKRGQRVILFCHDPTALPYLAEIQSVRAQYGRIEQTIVGHLHSEFVYKTSLVLSGLPTISFAGVPIKRMSSALQRARKWEPFDVKLCPSLTGIQAREDGGFLTVELDPDDPKPLEWEFHHLPWDAPLPEGWTEYVPG